MRHLAEKKGTRKPSGGANADALLVHTRSYEPPPNYVDTDTGEVVGVKKSKSEEVTLARRERYRLQSAARNALYAFHAVTPENVFGHKKYHRTCGCTFVSHADVSIVKAHESKKAFFSGLVTCANARTCPVCAGPINEKKATEMREAFYQKEEKDVIFSLLTFTAPHTKGDLITDLVPKISLALSAFWRGAPAKKFKERYGIVGNIRSFEVRYGGNGWHPHFHILIVSRRELPKTIRKNNIPVLNQSDEYNWILDRWRSACVNAGLDAPNEFGLDIRDGSGAGEYILKFGADGEFLKTRSGEIITWDVADELTKGIVKKGKKGSLSPWDILANSVDSKEEDQRDRFKMLFVNYARAMKGVTLVKWSRDLRKFFELGAEMTDAEIIAEHIEQAALYAFLSKEEWAFFRSKRSRVDLLEISERADSFALASFIYSNTRFCCNSSYESVTDYAAEFNRRL